MSCRIEFFQFRHKHLPTVERAAIAQELAGKPRRDTRLLLNGLDLSAEALDFDGVHLPASEEVRRARLVLPAKIVGCSVHTVDDAVSLSEQDVDYILLAPIFSALSKPDNRTPLGLEALRRACRLCRAPVIALGGMTPGRFHEVLDAGSAGIAGISLFSNPERLKEVVSIFRKASG